MGAPWGPRGHKGAKEPMGPLGAPGALEPQDNQGTLRWKLMGTSFYAFYRTATSPHSRNKTPWDCQLVTLPLLKITMFQIIRQLWDAEEYLDAARDQFNVGTP